MWNFVDIRRKGKMSTHILRVQHILQTITCFRAITYISNPIIEQRFFPEPNKPTDYQYGISSLPSKGCSLNFPRSSGFSRTS